MVGARRRSETSAELAHGFPESCCSRKSVPKKTLQPTPHPQHCSELGEIPAFEFRLKKLDHGGLRPLQSVGLHLKVF